MCIRDSDSTDLETVENIVAEDAAPLEEQDLEMSSASPSEIRTPNLYQTTETQLDVRECEEEILIEPEPETPVRRPPVHGPPTDIPPDEPECLEEPESFVHRPPTQSPPTEIPPDEILEEPEMFVQRPPTQSPSTNYPDERSCSPVTFDEEIWLLEKPGETAEELVVMEVSGALLEKASVVEEDICFVEEEDFVLEAMLDLQQLVQVSITRHCT